MKVLSVVGARPNFMKLAPVARAFAPYRDVIHRVVHTGQHYDPGMSDVFFRDLQLSPPDRQLAVGSGPATLQTAAILERLDAVLEEEAPDVVVVYGDVTSTLAAALAAAQRRIPVAHVEAGLRSHDRAMPEELNRVLADHACDRLYAPSSDAVDNLRREGIEASRICFAGNVMIDSLIRALPAARRAAAHDAHGLKRGRYVVATMHRPANVDAPGALTAILSALATIGRTHQVILPVHPRTQERIRTLGAANADLASLTLVEPLGYVEMLSLVDAAALVVTDSGGLQEETTFLGVPCITVRPSTERPVTVERGTNELVAADREAIVAAAAVRLDQPRGERRLIERWDGRAGARIAADIAAGHVAARPLTMNDALVAV